jgi:coproporphyrinogen III oxidase-like Fe-S oxidoreductase
MEALKELEDDELVLLNPNIEVTNLGQFFLRNIACIFDHYLQKQKKDGKQKKYSKAV